MKAMPPAGNVCVNARVTCGRIYERSIITTGGLSPWNSLKKIAVPIFLCFAFFALAAFAPSVSVVANEDLKINSADFINAEVIGNNKIIHTGNSINNTEQAYPDAKFIEYHFSGFNKEYQGID